MNLKIGGNNVGKIMYGDKQVGKMYFGGKLVYQNALPVGTILWTGDVNVSDAGYSFELEMSGVNNEWSNVTSDVKITYYIGKYTFTRVSTKEELLKGVYLKNSKTNESLGKATIVKNKLNITRLSFGWNLTKIELV